MTIYNKNTCKNKKILITLSNTNFKKIDKIKKKHDYSYNLIINKILIQISFFQRSIYVSKYFNSKIFKIFTCCKNFI